MKTIMMITFFVLSTSIYCQTPINDYNWNINNTFSDDFDLSRKNIWKDLDLNDNQVDENFRSNNIIYITESSKQFLRLVAEADGGIYYSAGIKTGFEDGYTGLGYGYYEIEARIIESSGIQSGLWPAFWTIHSWKPWTAPPYWYEEIDIFEPCLNR